MGIKDKLKRTSRIFLSESKEDVAEKGAHKNKGEIEQVNAEATATSGSGENEATSPDGANEAPTDNADGTLASSGEEGGVRDATREVSESAQHASLSAGEVGEASEASEASEAGGDKGAENGAMKRASLFKRVRSKSKKTAAAGEAKRKEFFLKIFKKFRAPAGGVGEKSEKAATDKSAAKSAATGEESVEKADEGGVQKSLLDPATEPVAEDILASHTELAFEPTADTAEPAGAAK